MRTIDHRAFNQRKSNKKTWPKKRVVFVFGIILAVFVVANGTVSLMYRGKALPGYSIGNVSIAGKSYADIETVMQQDLLPENIELAHKDRKQLMNVADLGVSVDHRKTLASIKNKPWVPVISLVKSTNVSFVLSVDQNKVETALSNVAPQLSQAPRNKHVVFDGTAFAVASASKGFELNQSKTQERLLRELAASKTHMTASVKELPAGNNDADLTAEVAALNKQLQTDVRFALGTQSITPTKAEIGAWYVENGDDMALSDAKVDAYLTALAQKFGSAPSNKADLTAALRYALPKQLKAHVRISIAGKSTARTYCVAAKGTPQNLLADVAGKLALTYADVRGWNADGAIAFEHVASGCSYTVWLTAPALMTSFGEICDDFYNCQVGTNVIVNSDRWQQATDPWRKTGQDVETYRLLIINHETGHRLGFRDNNICPGAGQPAPVMMQQSIDLKGCVFNVWPLPSELASLKTML